MMRRREGSNTESSSSNGDELKQRCGTSNNGTPTTVGSLSPIAREEEESQSLRPPPVLMERRKTGFLAFFARNDARQIKKIVYPHDNHHHQNNNNNKRNRSGRLRLVDFVYLLAVGLLCIGLRVGFKEPLLLVSNVFGRRPPLALVLPPNDKIPLEIRLGVKRRRLPLALTLEGVLAQGPAGRSDITRFEYPEILDNRTSMDDVYVTREKFYYPPKMDARTYNDGTFKDFGQVDIRFLEHDGQARTIYRERWEREGRARHLYQARDDDTEQYWAFDDDWLRNPYVSFDDPHLQDVHRCRRTNWARLSFPTGNLLHELDLLTHTPTLVGEGAYREVFIVERPVMGEIEMFVLKEIRFDNEMEYDSHEYVRVDSLVTERMTSNSQIVNLYGYSGWSMLAECFVHGDVEEEIVGFDDRIRSFDPLGDPELRTWNNFTGSEKLRLALSMVQPVAALHHYKDGVIIHDDIQLSQFLWTDESKTSVKLNDFNRAEIMFWDEEYGEYCKFRNGRGGGDWRAPEEYRNKPLNEKIDVWSLGNNFYSLLTGYYPFHNVEEGEAIRRKIARGATAVIDPRFWDRSFAERKLIEVIKRCHVYKSRDRADITEIQRMLEDAIAEDEWLKEQGLTGLEEDEGDDYGEYYDDDGGQRQFDHHDDETGNEHGRYDEENGSSGDYEEENYHGEEEHYSGLEESYYGRGHVEEEEPDLGHRDYDYGDFEEVRYGGHEEHYNGAEESHGGHQEEEYGESYGDKKQVDHSSEEAVSPEAPINGASISEIRDEAHRRRDRHDDESL